jgi:hypothetical protein
VDGDNRYNDTAIPELVTAVLLKIQVFWDVTLSLGKWFWMFSERTNKVFLGCSTVKMTALSILQNPGKS